MANLSKSKFIFDRIQELSLILLNSPEQVQAEDGKEVRITYDECEKYMRMLRPASHGNNHSNAARVRLRQKILNHPSTGCEGPVLLSRFDNACENLKKLDGNLLAPFLTFLMPVSFFELQSPAFVDAVQAERTIFNNAPHFDLNSRPKVLKPVIHDEMSRGASATMESSAPAPPKTNDLFPSFHDKVDLLSSAPLQSTPEFWISPDVERKLLQDVLYVLQGVTGKHIKYDTRTESYVVDPVLGVPSPARDLVLCVCELGWLYNKVALYLKTVFAHAMESRGLTVQAFGFSLQEEINEYYRLLAVIEQELNQTRQPVLSGAVSKSDVFESKKAEIQPTATDGNLGLTLLRLKAWMQEPTMRMFTLARLVDGAQGLSGGALLSRLHAHCRHGDIATCDTVQKIMDNVCKPLHTFVVRWVLDGDLNDTHSEFFIAVNPSPTVANVWKETYQLKHSNIPIFLPTVLAQKMVNIGKSINFMKLCKSRLQSMKGFTKKSTNFTSGGMRKSYRMINKNKKLGMYGQVIDVDDEVEKEKEDEAKDTPIDRDNTTGKLKDTSDGHSGLVSSAPEKKQLEDRVRHQMVRSGEAEDDEAKFNRPRDDEGDGDVLERILSRVSPKQLDEALYNLRCHQDLALSQQIIQLSREIDRLLLHVLKNDFRIYDHLLALKKFMLLGQGDFINCLIDNIGPELKKRASVLFKHNLLSILENSLRASNAQYEDESIITNVSIRLLEANVGDTGWEIFSLDYNIAIPINSIVHAHAMSQYRIAFHMLWRLKRVEWSLSNAWKDLTNLTQIIDKEYNATKYGRRGTSSSMSLQHIIDLRRVFHRCSLNRAGMKHIVNNLSEFLMFEVLETAWVKLSSDFEKAKCLDDIITAHDSYLAEILDKALLSPAHEALQLQIQQVLLLILRFCHLQETLVADTMASLARNRLADGAAAMADSPMNAGGNKGGKSMSLTTVHESVPVHIVSRIDETVKEYSSQFDTLMTMLKEEGEKSGEILRYLTFRLDFNSYHEQQRSKGVGLGITSTPRNFDSSRPGSGSRGFNKGQSFGSTPDLKPTKLSLIEE